MRPACSYLLDYVLPGWDNRSFSRSQGQPTDAIGLDLRCSAGGWICRAGPRPSRTSGCLTDSSIYVSQGPDLLLRW